ncbi:MAG: toll/interleukin-1 receptor domain-containing protein [Bacteroidales bacterium]|nr:toll/interleukin-1 receptor domain-containing protein [Bacteroidales bacterium]
MAFFTKKQFESIANSKAGYKGLQGFVNEARQYSRRLYTTSIFLSHAHTDKSVVKQAITFFRTLGIDVYVDWMDKTMPERPNGATANKIKLKIIENDKFILLATNSAVKSKWCNWEVGIGDTYKYLKKKLAILPLADNSGHWEGNEYLQIYPSIQEFTTQLGKNFFIKYPDGSIERLKQWLNK